MKLIQPSFTFFCVFASNVLFQNCYATTTKEVQRVESLSESSSSSSSSSPEELRSVLRKEIRRRRQQEGENDISNGPTEITFSDNASGDGEESVSDGAASGEPCFSSYNMVRIQGGKGGKETEGKLISIKNLKVGDYVHDGNYNDDQNNKNKNSYSRVISLAHLDRTIKTEFIQIYTSYEEKPLEITKKHMMFVKGEREKDFVPIRADKVKIGDIVIGNNNEMIVSNIQYIIRNGVYAPITESGTIIVNGIKASSYFEFFNIDNDDNTIAITPSWILKNQHNLAHYFFAPYRLICNYDFNYCYNEEHDKNGYSTNFGIDITLNILSQCNEYIFYVKLLLTLCAYPFLISFYLFEQSIIASSSLLSFFVTIIGAIVFGRKFVYYEKFNYEQEIKK